MATLDEREQGIPKEGDKRWERKGYQCDQNYNLIVRRFHCDFIRTFRHQNNKIQYYLKDLAIEPHRIADRRRIVGYEAGREVGTGVEAFRRVLAADKPFAVTKIDAGSQQVVSLKL